MDRRTKESANTFTEVFRHRDTFTMGKVKHRASVYKVAQGPVRRAALTTPPTCVI